MNLLFRLLAHGGALLLAWMHVPALAQYYGAAPPVSERSALHLTGGAAWIRGDVQADPRSAQGGLAWVRPYNRILDLSVSIQAGQAFGLGLGPSTGFRFNSAYNGEAHPGLGYDSTAAVHLSYRCRYGVLGAGMAVNLNRLIDRRGAGSWDLYVLGGLGALFSRTAMDAMQGDAQPYARYDFSSVPADAGPEARTALRSLLDGQYETPGQRDRISDTFVGGYAVHSAAQLGAGLRLALGQDWLIGAELRYWMPGDDLLDGQQWTDGNQPSTSKDRLIQAGLTLGRRL